MLSQSHARGMIPQFLIRFAHKNCWTQLARKHCSAGSIPTKDAQAAFSWIMYRNRSDNFLIYATLYVHKAAHGESILTGSVQVVDISFRTLRKYQATFSIRVTLCIHKATPHGITSILYRKSNSLRELLFLKNVV